MIDRGVFKRAGSGGARTSAGPVRLSSPQSRQLRGQVAFMYDGLSSHCPPCNNKPEVIAAIVSCNSPHLLHGLWSFHVCRVEPALRSPSPHLPRNTKSTCRPPVPSSSPSSSSSDSSDSSLPNQCAGVLTRSARRTRHGRCKRASAQASKRGELSWSVRGEHRRPAAAALVQVAAARVLGRGRGRRGGATWRQRVADWSEQSCCY